MSHNFLRKVQILLFLNIFQTLCSSIFLNPVPSQLIVKGYNIIDLGSTLNNYIYQLNLNPFSISEYHKFTSQIQFLYDFGMYSCEDISFDVSFDTTLFSNNQFLKYLRQNQITFKIVVFTSDMQYFEYLKSFNDLQSQQIRQNIKLNFSQHQKKEFQIFIDDNTTQSYFSAVNISIGPFQCINNSNRQNRILRYQEIKKNIYLNDEKCVQYHQNCLTCLSQNQSNKCAYGLLLVLKNECIKFQLSNSTQIHLTDQILNSLQIKNGCLQMNDKCVICLDKFLGIQINGYKICVEHLDSQNISTQNQQNEWYIKQSQIKNIISNLHKHNLVEAKNIKSSIFYKTEECLKWRQISIIEDKEILCVDKCPEKYYYFDQSTNFCVSCSDGCLTCNQDKCLQCDERFQAKMNYNNSELICLPKDNTGSKSLLQKNTCEIENCKVCKHNQNQQIYCDQCDQGHYLHQNRCLQKMQCLEQGLALSYNFYQQFCTYCQNHNQKISDNFCLSKIQGKYLKLDHENQIIEESCEKCTHNLECLECEINKQQPVSSQCNHFDLNGFCIEDLQNQLENSKLHICQNNKFQQAFESSTSQCIHFQDANCVSIDKTKNICIKCKQGFFMDSAMNYCRKCHDSCKECFNEAQICNDNIQKLRSLSFQQNCQQENCQACNSFGQKPKCVQCISGYYVDSNNVCQLCPSNCSTCSSSNPQICTQCNEFYYINTKSGTCNFCEEGYYNQNQSTNPKNVICGLCDSSCNTCSGPNYTDCITCNYSLSKSQLTGTCQMSNQIQSEIDLFNQIRDLNCLWVDRNKCLQQQQQSQNLSNLSYQLQLASIIIGSTIGIISPEVSSSVWFYFQNQQLIGNSYFLNQIKELSLTQLHLKNAYAYNFFVLFSNPYSSQVQNVNKIDFYSIEILQKTNNRLLMIEEVQQFYPLFVQNCFYQFSVLIGCIIILCLLFFVGKWHDLLERTYQYCRWNLLIRLFMVCSNFIMISAFSFFNLEAQKIEHKQSITDSKELCSFVMAAISLLIFLFLQFKILIFFMDYRQRYDCQSKILYISILENLRENKIIYQIFWTIFEAKKVANVAVLVFVNSSSSKIIQWIFFSLEFAFLVYTLVFKLFNTKFLNHFMSFLQMLHVFLSLLLALTFTLSNNRDAQSYFCYVFIIVTIVLHISVICFSLVVPITNYIVEYRKKKREAIANVTCCQTQVITQQMSENIEEILNISLSKPKKRKFTFNFY
ncbi:hypothetical protein ABPG72_012328 [Tetrahymena utriculariae]